MLTDKSKENILCTVRKIFQGTVLSFPERDPSETTWGDPKYNGNCSGFVPLGFADKLNAKSICELFAGSGTTSDMCRDFNIPYAGIDLNPTPVRKDIISMDILDPEEDLPDAFYQADMVFSHPPYPGINRIKYCNSAWKDTVGNLSEKDIQNMPFEKGMRAINYSTMRAYAALPKGSFLVLLVGEIRSKGHYYSMFQNLAIPGVMFQTYVKIQNNASSFFSTYGKSQRALTMHEMIAVIRKPSGYEMAYIVPRVVKLDMRDAQCVTWKDVVMAYAYERHSFTTKEIENDLKNHQRGRNNQHVEEKIRQTCQQLVKAGLLVHPVRGTWQLAA